MTSKEAIRVLEDNRPSVIFEDKDAQKRMAELCQAIDMAIEALSADRPMGEWINQDNGAFYPYECSNCHEQPFCDDYGYHLTNYCPNCGAIMKGGAE